ncbi:hypothetical protein Pmar_PMAR007218 [Perkinsus marinus ATCC 50983]|uniref:PA14 domain-containing protein n=1 Tax=Perkinsus marinus (strain ATCC 50983 / TXsc) TaxID=423536 RepID=C5LWP5_PERM5|nr:hypothetical protein Pmar_PMAR007218 [Perkinsus marinus ATCC 50983]EEQ98840.1 hypothetical protein Pmar_PMAR007218 [Perkinsus marinus ATCC 50983]|eukprot:XP_002766123.1 hypothetical protein Pmar_PMAR007218 [Perkinsus marinus ATCC 50983]
MKEGVIGDYGLLYDGTGYPTVREYLVTELKPYVTYSFRLYASNTVGTSRQLEAFYTVQSEIGGDPSYLTGSSYTFPLQLSAGVADHQLRIQGVHPITGALEYLGGNCLISEDSTCLSGRMFVAYLEPVCEVDVAKALCEPVSEANPRWTSPRYDTTETPSWWRPIRATDLGNGQYDVTITGYRPGNYSLILQALWQYGLFGNYWDNSIYLGSPIESRVDPVIDFNWEAGSVARWSPDFVSVRWTGFIEAAYNDTYTFYCEIADANDNCRIWLDGILIAERWFEDGKEVIVDKTALSEKIDVSYLNGHPNSIALRTGELYPIQVDYRERTDTASIRLLWSSSVWQGKEVVSSKYLHRGAYLEDAPFPIVVGPGKPYGPKSVVKADGNELTRPIASQKTTLYVQTRDVIGNDCDTFYSDTVVLASLTPTNPDSYCQTHPLGVMGEPMVTMGSGGNGVYVVHVVLVGCGQHNLSVTVNGLHVEGSPFAIDIQRGTVSAFQVVANGTATTQFQVGIRSYIDLILRDAVGNPASVESLDPKRHLEAVLTWLSPHDRLNLHPQLPSSPANTTSCDNFTWSDWRTSCGDFEFLEDFLYLSTKFPVSIQPVVESVDSNLSLIRLAFTSYRAGPSVWMVSINETRIRGPMVSSPDIARSGVLDTIEARENYGWYAWGLPETEAYGPMSIIQHADLHHLWTSPILANVTNITLAVLLRDRYGNILSVDTGQSVTIRIRTPVGVSDKPCSYVGDGQFFCSIIPTVAGTSEELSVDVDGLPASVVMGDAPIGSQCYGPEPCNTDQGRPGVCDCRQELVQGKLCLVDRRFAQFNHLQVPT